MYAALGLHPWHVPADVDAALDSLRELADAMPPVAIGETGLDKSRRGAPRELQVRAFEGQVALARELDVPLILHVVRSHGACLERVRGHSPGGMVHDFQGPVETVRDWVQAGFFLSISPRGMSKVDVIRAIPDEALLVETDDFGSERLVDVIEAVADARSTTPELVAALTAASGRRLVGGGRTSGG